MIIASTRRNREKVAVLSTSSASIFILRFVSNQILGLDRFWNLCPCKQDAIPASSLVVREDGARSVIQCRGFETAKPHIGPLIEKVSVELIATLSLSRTWGGGSSKGVHFLFKGLDLGSIVGLQRLP